MFCPPFFQIFLKKGFLSVDTSSLVPRNGIICFVCFPCHWLFWTFFWRRWPQCKSKTGNSMERYHRFFCNLLICFQTDSKHTYSRNLLPSKKKTSPKNLRTLATVLVVRTPIAIDEKGWGRSILRGSKLAWEFANGCRSVMFLPELGFLPALRIFGVHMRGVPGIPWRYQKGVLWRKNSFLQQVPEKTSPSGNWLCCFMVSHLA